MVKLKFKKLNGDAIIPVYQKEGDAGFDFHAVIDCDNPYFVKSGEYSIYDSSLIRKRVVNDCLIIPSMCQCVVRTGLSVEIPIGYELQVRPRSGLAFKKSITVTNSPGTIDSGYRGEIMVILFNLGTSSFIVDSSDRIAQGVISVVPKVEIEEVEELSDTDRGSGGFGSTGKK